MIASFLYDPEAKKGEKWTIAAEYKIPRLYHSSMLLLADGRVVSLGSEMQNINDFHPSSRRRPECFPSSPTGLCTDPFEYKMEIYEPPYLFLDVERPIVRSAPETVNYKQTFLVSLETDATKIETANFVRYSTSTHSTNMDQRLVELLIIQKNQTHLILQAPANSAIAPPGNYHLFLLREGMPSKAPTVRLKLGEGDQSLTALVNGIHVNPVNNGYPFNQDNGDSKTNSGLSVSYSGVLSIISLFALIN